MWWLQPWLRPVHPVGGLNLFLDTSQSKGLPSLGEATPALTGGNQKNKVTVGCFCLFDFFSLKKKNLIFKIEICGLYPCQSPGCDICTVVT